MASIDQLLQNKSMKENEVGMIKVMHEQVFGNEAATEESLHQLAGLLSHIAEVI